ncbi:MAG: hypothetical protein NW207_12570 [Cytophagales bacterium]|nr:hypothetical protein [Cytophagales bacterium]
MYRINNSGQFFTHVGTYIALICIAICCKTQTEKVEFDTQIVARVIDDQGKGINGATVALYDQKIKFDTDINTGTPANALYSAPTFGDDTTFKNLTPEVKYWIAVFYKDTTRIPKYSINVNNSNINNEFAVIVRKGSINYVRIKILPQEGLVTFYAKTPDNQRLPLSVTINKIAVGNITQTYDVIPTYSSAGVVTYLTKKGLINYNVSSADCAWQGQISITGGNTHFVELTPCESGTLAFWSDIAAPTEYPIEISLPQLNETYTINAPLTNATCSTPGLLKTNKAAGEYTYKATTKSGNCTKVGVADVRVNECMIIKIEGCN